MSDDVQILEEGVWVKASKFSQSLLVFPTATVWSLGCVPEASAISHLQTVKTFREDKPFLLLWASKKHLCESLHDIPGGYRQFIERYVDQHVTCVIPTSWLEGTRWIPSACISHQGKIAIRVDQLQPLRELIQASGYVAWISTSANRPGQPPQSNIEKTGEFFKSLPAPKILFEYTGQFLGQASTLVDVEEQRVLRAGPTVPVIPPL